MSNDFEMWDKRYPLDAAVWFRDSTQEWVLEIQGSINDVGFSCRHPQPKELAPQDVPGLPTRYSIGYIFRNPRTGPDFSPNHPIESGEVPDATDINEAQCDVLLGEMLEAWGINQELTQKIESLQKSLSEIIEVAESDGATAAGIAGLLKECLKKSRTPVAKK